MMTTISQNSSSLWCIRQDLCFFCWLPAVVCCDWYTGWPVVKLYCHHLSCSTAVSCCDWYIGWPVVEAYCCHVSCSTAVIEEVNSHGFIMMHVNLPTNKLLRSQIQHCSDCSVFQKSDLVNRAAVNSHLLQFDRNVWQTEQTIYLTAPSSH